MIPVVAVQVDTSNPNHKYLCAIEFDMDNGKPFCYRGRTSYEAFTNPLKLRNHNKRGKVRYYCKHKEQYEFDKELWKGTMERHPNVPNIYDIPTIKLKTLWDFYYFIGYDYKGKRWGIS